MWARTLAIPCMLLAPAHLHVPLQWQGCAYTICGSVLHDAHTTPDLSPASLMHWTLNHHLLGICGTCRLICLRPKVHGQHTPCPSCIIQPSVCAL